MARFLMLACQSQKGFSLLEVLVSLFLVSLAAVNITGLQQAVAAQNRDNFIHSAVLKIATEEMEKVLQYQSLSQLENLDHLAKQQRRELQTGTVLNLTWQIAMPEAQEQAGSKLRTVTLQIDWNDSIGAKQTFNYSELVNLTQLLSPNSDAAKQAAIIESFLGIDEDIYFDPKMSYKEGAFVIYNSELFEATSNHQVAHGESYDVSNSLVTADGWKNYGSIANSALADDPHLARLFLE